MRKPEGSFELEVPYKDKILKGDALLVTPPTCTPATNSACPGQLQLEKWVRSGVIEPSCGAAITQVAEHDMTQLCPEPPACARWSRPSSGWISATATSCSSELAQPWVT